MNFFTKSICFPHEKNTNRKSSFFQNAKHQKGKYLCFSNSPRYFHGWLFAEVENTRESSDLLHNLPCLDYCSLGWGLFSPIAQHPLWDSHDFSWVYWTPLKCGCQKECGQQREIFGCRTVSADLREATATMPALIQLWIKEQRQPQINPTGTPSSSKNHNASFSSSSERVLWRGINTGIGPHDDDSEWGSQDNTLLTFHQALSWTSPQHLSVSFRTADKHIIHSKAFFMLFIWCPYSCSLQEPH